jgi:hypothetical protein
MFMLNSQLKVAYRAQQKVRAACADSPRPRPLD